MAKAGKKKAGKKQEEWNLKPLFLSDDDSNIEKKRIIWKEKTYSFINKWKSRNDYLKDPIILKQALDEYEEWARLYGCSGDEGYYFWLRSEQDQNDHKLKAKFSKVEEFSKKLENDIQFFTMRIAKIPENEQKKFMESPALAKYRHYLKKSFENAKYLLSEPEEKIMNLKSTSSHSLWVKMTSGFLAKEEAVIIDEDGKKRKKAFSAMASLMRSTNKKTRDSVADAFNKILEKHSDAAESEINAILLDKKINDELRGFKRADESRHIGDDIETEVVDSMGEAVSTRFDISQRYYRLKARLLGVKKLKYYERNIEYGKVDKKYNYNGSLKLVRNVFDNLDKKFTSILDEFAKNSQIDVYPRKGKTSGAFCVHFLKSQPTYILLNHTGKLNDVLTLAHEFGHAINAELMREKQHALYFETTLATAEVSSTFMEDFVLRELLKEADDNLKLALLMQRLDAEVSTIMRQVACYKFEQEVHKEFREKSHLSKEDIGKIFQKNMASYMGPYVEQSAGSENWWVYWSHIRNFFYVYSYASGLLISKAMQKKVRENPRFIEKVKEFLSAGTSESPKNIFMKMGVDISNKKFWYEGIDEVENLLNETEKLARKMGRT